MIQINRLKLAIKASSQNTLLGNFGFDITLKKGLNIIKGENTSGKSTIVSCIFYALCLEEILGSKYAASLDSSLKKQFYINKKLYHILSSYIYIEIENHNGLIYTLRRSIKSANNNEKFLITLRRGSIKDTTYSLQKLFIHKERNHSSEQGYFKWFADFLGLTIPKVIGQKGTYMPLYIQTMFPSLFIEQTKGWSDFLASIPYFGIKHNKERVFEFLMNLKSLSNEVEKERLNEIKKELLKKWENVINKIETLTVSNSGKVLGISNEPFDHPSLINDITIEIKDGVLEEDGYLTLDLLLLRKEKENRDINLVPNLKENTSKNLKRLLETAKEELQNYQNAYDDFLLEYNEQKKEVKAYKSFREDLQKEILINQDIRYLSKKDNTINQLQNCPTCHQELKISINKVASTDFDIQFKTIEGNLKYLKNQEKLLTSSIKSLQEILQEKEIINNSFKEEMDNLRLKIKQIRSEYTDPETFPSRIKIQEKIRLENKILKLHSLKEALFLFKKELKEINDEFNINHLELVKLSKSLKNDKDVLSKFETDFKNLLIDFEYSSNPIQNILIQKESPFKYLPVVKYQDSYVQKIQLNSSASDFIRSIWAYTISLLINAKNHPGIILFDEPSQHSMKSTSLRRMLYRASKLNNYQTIIAASTDMNENKKDGKVIYSIDSLLENLDYNEYTIQGKAIQPM